jgi:hypothetical protein
MTAQAEEILIYKGEELSLFSEPLGDLLHKLHPTYESKYLNTSCWRGYYGTWSIEQNHLYLIKLEGLGGEEDPPELCLGDVFPNYPDGVFAHWYSGTLRCVKGELLEYVHAGYSSQYEEDLYIQIQRGVVIDEKLIRNAADPKNISSPT